MAERTVTITSPDLDGSGTPGPIELAITEAGEGGRPLLLLHGFGGRRHDFEDHVEDLAGAGWHVVAPDHRGHGDSDDPAGEDAYTIEILAADALVLADELGWDRFVLLGHSMGGMVAQVIALDAPDRLEGLVLMNTSHGPIPMDENLIATAVAICRTHGIDALADAVAALGPDGPLTTPAHRRVVEERPGYAERAIDTLRACSPEM